MPPNVRDLVGDIREAVERLPQEALADILVYVFKTYVVEGPAPLGASAPVVRDELEGMSFAEVVRALQLRLDLPELELFEVQGERVSLRVQGRSIPVEARATQPEPPPPVAHPPAPAAPPPPVVAAPAAAPVAAPAARPTPAVPAPVASAPKPEPPAAPPRGGLLEID